MLTPIQQHWDNATAEYNLEKYNWPAWALSVIQEVAPEVTELETMHTVLEPSQLVRVQQHVQNACSRRDFMEKFDQYAAEIVKDRIDGRRYLIQRQGTLRVVIPNQASVGRRLAFHQGIMVGNGRDCRTIWTPFTKCGGTNTMWIMDLDVSREITKRVLSEKWSLQHFEDVCIAESWPVTLVPGQAHLFMQEHIHGNVNNEDNYTRVSLDMRILLEGEEWGRRLPGGFFRLPGDYEVDEIRDYTGKRFITYAGWNTVFSKNIPLPMQRGVIEPYCKKHNISYNDYQFENEHMDWLPGLEDDILQQPHGIVMCSMFSLPDDPVRRDELLELALEKNVELHFANELCSLRSRDDLTKLQTYLNFAVPKKGLYVWEE